MDRHALVVLLECANVVVENDLLDAVYDRIKQDLSELMQRLSREPQSVCGECVPFPA